MPTIAPAKASVKTRIEAVAGRSRNQAQGLPGICMRVPPPSRESPRGSPDASASSGPTLTSGSVTYPRCVI